MHTIEKFSAFFLLGWRYGELDILLNWFLCCYFSGGEWIYPVCMTNANICLWLPMSCHGFKCHMKNICAWKPCCFSLQVSGQILYLCDERTLPILWDVYVYIRLMVWQVTHTELKLKAEHCTKMLLFQHDYIMLLRETVLLTIITGYIIKLNLPSGKILWPICSNHFTYSIQVCFKITKNL